MKENIIVAQGDKVNGHSLMVLKSEGKLEHLNQLQEKHKEVIKKFWNDYIFSCHNSINKEKASIGAEWMYKLAGYEKPIMVYVDSPMGCQYAIHLLKTLAKNGTRDSVWTSVWDSVWAGKMEYNSFAWYGSICDYGWVSFYDFFTQIGVIDHKLFNEFKELLLSGVYDMIQLNGFCIVSDLPKKIVRNDAGRLHNPKGPAIEFKDGYCQYYINGRNLPAWIWEKADKGEITKELFLAEKNVEIKGGIYEVLGQVKMMELLGSVEVDSKQIVHANGDIETVTLLKTKEKFEEIANQPFSWVKIEHKPLALGEHSGHMHVLTGPNVELFEHEGKIFACVGADGARLQHVHDSNFKPACYLRVEELPIADHASHLLPAGVYEFHIQNAFNPYAKMMEKVID